MEVTMVGSGCGIPNPERGSPCIAVSTAGQLLAFDCGPGALRAMAAAGVDWSALDRVFITHFHTDHIADLGPLLFAYNIPDVNRDKSLKLYGPPGLRRLYQNLVAAYGDWLVPKRFDLDIQELDTGPLAADNDEWRVEVAPANHSKPAYAYRFEADGASFVYSGDTDYSEDIVALASECDILILECSYPNSLEVEGHLTPKKAGKMARISGCKKMVLVHLYPFCAGYDLARECKETWDGEVLVGEDGQRFSLGRGQAKD